MSKHVVGSVFRPDEWDLLVHLPAQVMITATAVDPDSACRTVAERLAGIDAIAGGRAFDSELVRAVVAAIYAEPDQGGRPARAPRSDRVARPTWLARAAHVVRPAQADLPARPADRARAPEPAGRRQDLRQDRRQDLRQVLASCRSAAAILAGRVDPADSAAYRQWVQSIAARVCTGARTGMPGASGSTAQRRFLDQLGTALGLA